jgi:hypothetical protein
MQRDHLTVVRKDCEKLPASTIRLYVVNHDTIHDAYGGIKSVPAIFIVSTGLVKRRYRF